MKKAQILETFSSKCENFGNLNSTIFSLFCITKPFIVIEPFNLIVGV
jgi:hypothetical protein